MQRYETDKKHGFLRVAVEKDDYIDRYNEKGQQKEAQMRQKDKKNPTEDDVNATKRSVSSGHEAFRGAFYDGLARNLDDGFLGRGKFYGESSELGPSPVKRKGGGSAPDAEEAGQEQAGKKQKK